MKTLCVCGCGVCGRVVCVGVWCVWACGVNVCVCVGVWYECVCVWGHDREG